MKICSLTKTRTLTSSIHLNKELSKITNLEVLDWNYYYKIYEILAPLFNIIKLRKLLKEFDVLHIQYDFAGYMFLFLPILWILSISKKAKIVITLHEKYDNVPFSKLVIEFHNLFYRVADVLLVHTEEHKKFMAKSLWSRTQVIPHGVISAGKIIRKPKKHSILIAGYVTSWKGHDLAIKAIPLILKRFPNAGLITLGKAYDLKFTEQIHNLIKNLKISKNVELHEDFILEKDMFPYFDKAEICLLPYRRATMSGILSHIISRGVPSVISDLEPFVEVTKKKGIYFKNGDANDLAIKAVHLLKNKKLQDKISKDFRKLANEYSWQNVAKQTFNVYMELLK